VLIDRDYAQQEPRILAHFGDGELMQHYNSDPWLDLYDKVTAILCEKQGLTYKRKEVKIVVLGLIYGKGVTLLASELGTSLEEAQQLKEIILNLFPELRALTKMMKQRERGGLPIRTWGGRLYYCEKMFLNGNLISFGYKLVNTLIQGSAADCTKEAINRVHRFVNDYMRDWYVILNVHDEIVMSVPPEDADDAMEILRQCMEGIEFDVPMLSEGSMSSTTWAQLIDYDKKGVLCQPA
jgi:DNA polymerase I-like protein with 3'-5' exonuclease and polymerase domains